jgi:hypothetical protein
VPHVVYFGIIWVQGCNEPLRSEVNDREKVLLRPFEIEPSALFDWSKYFVFSSKVELTLGKTGEQSISREFIEAKGSDGQIHLSKKIDDAHYFEVFADEQNYFVKNREGEWRENRDNKPFVQALIKDGFNANDWVIEHLALAEFLLKDTKRSTTNKNIYVLQMRRLSPRLLFGKTFFNPLPISKILKKPLSLVLLKQRLVGLACHLLRLKQALKTATGFDYPPKVPSRNRLLSL